jgi:hypothetical protein
MYFMIHGYVHRQVDSQKTFLTMRRVLYQMSFEILNDIKDNKTLELSHFA